MATTISTKKRTYTPEQRLHNAAYLRQYRKKHPDAVRRWRDAYILRRAEKLKAAQAEGGADCGGN